jgi:hypothetical protein
MPLSVQNLWNDAKRMEFLFNTRAAYAMLWDAWFDQGNLD